MNAFFRANLLPCLVLLVTSCNDSGTPPGHDTSSGIDSTPGEDDSDSGTHDSFAEVCDGVDNDGDGLIDEADPNLDLSTMSTFYADSDTDGFGDPSANALFCVLPSGYASNAGDCDDANAQVHPGATETCNAIDDDCDGLIDLKDPDLDLTGVGTYFRDLDGDGFGAGDSFYGCWDPTCALADGDCDDTNPAIYPDAIENCTNGIDDNCDGVTDQHCTAVLPLAASADVFQTQGAQEWFQNDLGEPCQGRIVAGLGDQALCYADSTGELYCAGRIFTHDFGSTFVDVGVGDVRQIFITQTVTSATGNAIWVRSGNELLCMGDFNWEGQSGNGTTDPSSDFVPWGDGMAVDAVATGSYDQLCARSLDDGNVYCSGYSYGSTPVVGAFGPIDRYYVDSWARLIANDYTEYRAGDTRVESFVSAVGGWGFWLSETYGTPSHVVSFDVYDLVIPQWLEDDGSSYIRYDEDWLPEKTVLAFVGNAFMLTWCAVVTDGSMWCKGDNPNGLLGLGHEDHVDEPTQVLPPGTFDLSCH
jgi:hypothetical protein